MKVTYTKFIDKISKDYWAIIDLELEKDKRDIIANAYELSHYAELYDLLSCIYPKDFKDNIELWTKIYNCEENVYKKIYDDWLDYEHPERYNFFCYEDLIEIVQYTFRDKR